MQPSGGILPRAVWLVGAVMMLVELQLQTNSFKMQLIRPEILGSLTALPTPRQASSAGV
jgi:hypothetical protein